MRASKLVSKKVFIPAAIVAVAIGLTIWGLSPAIAAVNQTINNAGPGFLQVPNITGSINTGQTVKNFIKDNLKVPFQQASEIAAKQIANGTILGGHLGIVQGYLVYTFFAVNSQDHTGHMIIVDAGNGKVLYASQGQPLGSFGSMFGPFGALRAHGFSPFGGFGGFWHGQFAPWQTHIPGQGL
jgi:hypothetical protein